MASDLASAVGARVRALRDGGGKTQEEVARAARELGLEWSRFLVMALETSSGRGLSAGELLVLPLVLGRALGTKVTLAGLIPDGRMALGADLELSADQLRRMLRGGAAPKIVQVNQVAERDEAAEMRARARALYPHEASPNLFDLVRASRDSRGDVEQKVAGLMRVSSLVVAVAALQTWGRSITAERDSRVRRRIGDHVPSRSRQAIRGHITRQLVRELGPQVEEIQERDRRQGRKKRRRREG